VASGDPVLRVLGELLVDNAALAAALNCTRVGADLPTGTELATARGER
jgi:fructokinase